MRSSIPKLHKITWKHHGHPAPFLAKHNEDALDMLEGFANQVRKGELTTVAVMGVTPNGNYIWNAVSGWQRLQILAAATRLIYRLNETQCENIPNLGA